MLLFILFMILLNIFLKNRKFKYDLFPVIIIIMILMAGLKYDYSIDYDNYLIHFNEINMFKDVLNTGFEKGYSLMIYIYKLLNLGFNTFLLSIAFISIACKAKMIKRYSVLPEISLLLYFLLFFVFNDLEQIRHGIAAGLCLYSINFMMKDDKLSKAISIAFIIIATLFHYSAFCFIIVYFVKDHLFKKKTYIYLFILSLFISFIDISKVIKFLNDLLLHSQYIKIKLDAYQVSGFSFVSLTLLIKCFIMIIYAKFVFDPNDKYQRILFNVYYYGIIISCIFNSIPIMQARCSLYMRYMEIFIIPLYLVGVKNKRIKTKNYYIHYIILSGIFIYYIIKFIGLIKNPEYLIYSSI